jgi:DNA-binding NarL/FixJ family response regulator
MYTALATIVADPERQLWHRAMSAEGADEDIAAALENYARTARGRGAVTVAGAALERAAALTADAHKKGARLLGAAEIAYELGLADVIRRLLPQAAQELQIAQFAAEGLSNREIGERLFLSHRTVGGHLYRIFPKLEITGRAQLRDALTRVTKL